MLMELSESSPRMRGKPHRVPEHDALVRIIPAHAGQTHACYHPDRDRTDHPRACGANTTPMLNTALRAGSSPRMRGKRVVYRRSYGLERIIPAHAGQTTRPAGRPDSRPDHPRACGANASEGDMRGFDAGSSPRMRGKRERQGTADRFCRIIPAHAGQTDAMDRTGFPHPDHPRACGAN